MLEQLAEHAAAHGITRFDASVMAGNRRMLGVFASAGFGVRRQSEWGEVLVSLDIRPTEQRSARIAERDHRGTVASLQPLLAPRSLAVLGASEREDSAGGTLMRNVVRGGFQGVAAPVNRGGWRRWWPTPSPTPRRPWGRRRRWTRSSTRRACCAWTAPRPLRRRRGARAPAAAGWAAGGRGNQLGRAGPPGHQRLPRADRVANPIDLGRGAPESGDVESAIAAAARISGPVAMKADFPPPSHAGDVDAVLLGLEGADAVRAGWRELERRVGEVDRPWTGALVQPLEGPGADLLVGAVADAVLGPVMGLGLGGRPGRPGG